MDELFEYLAEAIQAYPDDDYQRGHLTALVEVYRDMRLAEADADGTADDEIAWPAWLGHAEALLKPAD